MTKVLVNSQGKAYLTSSGKAIQFNEPVINTLNVTPSTSAQTINTTTGVDGYAPVNVSAVTSSIDANISTSNIKNGVTILGVTGSYKGMSEVVTATNTTGSAINRDDKVWIEKVNSSYNLINSKKRNYVVNGTLTIDDKNETISGFSSANYINQWVGLASSHHFKMYVKFTTPDSMPTDNTWWFKVMNNSDFIPFYLDPYAGKIVAFGKTAGSSSWNIFSNKEICALTTSTTYKLMCEFTGSAYIWYQYTDGSWVELTRVTSSSNVGGSSIVIGKVDGNGTFGNGTIDLSECRLEVDNEVVWQPYVSNITESTVTGYAQENIANNASGSVSFGDLDKKFGISINNLIGNVNFGILEKPSTSPSENIVFSDVQGIESGALSYMFYTNTNLTLKTISFPSLIHLYNSSSLNYFCSGTGISSILFPELISIEGTTCCTAMCSSCTNLTSVSFPKLTTIGGENANSNICTSAFQSCTSLTSVSFPELTTIKGSNSCKDMFRSCTSLTSVSFPELTTLGASSSSVCSGMFYGCSNITSASFPKLTTVNSQLAFNQIFYGCSKLASIDFSELTTLNGGQEMQQAFYNTLIESINFTKLSTIYTQSFRQAFQNCKKLKNIYFNALTTNSFGSYVNQFQNTFNSTTGSEAINGCTVHFPSNLSSKVASLTGYPTFGGNSNYITISFDLAATS